MSRNRRNRNSHVESLESRQLLAADIAAGRFILHVNNVHGNAAVQLAAVNALLQKFEPQAHASKWLGADGLTLVQTDPAVTQDQIRGALKNAPGFLSLD